MTDPNIRKNLTAFQKRIKEEMTKIPLRNQIQEDLKKQGYHYDLEEIDVYIEKHKEENHVKR